MKKIVLLSALTTALLTSFAAHAADTTELKVKGVIRPAACAPNFTGGSTIDYGTIKAADLPKGQFLKLADKPVEMKVTCDSKTKVAFKAVDNRAASRVEGIMANAQANFGLGEVNGKKVGGYKLKFDPASTIDAVKADNRSSVDKKAWAGGVDELYRDTFFSMSTTADGLPTSGENFIYKFNLTAFLNKPENLDLTNDVPLDGSATIEVSYL